ncbi:MAG: WYL domain-containing protein [Richelia sp. RM2_1_2]|nr:WYL domain-containing protein [Richelia sp. RM2_1_2]
MNELKLLISNIQKFRLSSLNEGVDKNLLVKAIKDKEVLYIYYAGDKTIHKGWRTVEPHVVGVSKAGNPVVRAWQQAGVSDTKEGLKGPPTELPGWRLFRLDGISTLYGTAKTFKPNHPKYNPNDSQMTSITISVKADGIGGFEDDEIEGEESIDEPNVRTQKVAPINKPQASTFDKQSNKFKSFFNKDTNLGLKDYVESRFNIMKHSHKKSPKNYFVGKRGNSFFVDDIANQGNYKKQEIVGNLKDLFLKQNKSKIDAEKKSFFDKKK